MEKIVFSCDVFPHTILFKALYTFASFSFLRLSDILPQLVTKFDDARHLCVAVVVFSDTGPVIIPTWSKVRQDTLHIDTISIPNLGRAVICPISVL